MIAEVEERRRAQFVDRKTEMRRFRDLLGTPDRPILVVWGEGGIGKTSLLEQMVHECAQRGLPKVRVLWRDTRRYDYLGIMREVRDDLGAPCAAHFNAFNERVNFFTVPRYEFKLEVTGSVTAAGGAQFTSSTVEGDIAGVKIQDLMLVAPRTDIAVPESERMIRLTDDFLQALTAALESIGPGGPLVVFFDAVEKMSTETCQWVAEELLEAVRDGRLGNIRFVLCGRERPPLGMELGPMVEEAELQPLGLADITEYLACRGVEQDRSALALMLFAATKGNPLLVATHVQSYLNLLANQAREPAAGGDG